MIPQEELLYTIAINQVHGIGPVVAKELIRKIGSAQQVFELSSRELQGFKTIGESIIAARGLGQVFTRAEQELLFIEHNSIEAIHYKSNEYPRGLSHQADSPLILFKKGGGRLNELKTISIVGTRKATPYGKDFCRQLCEEISELSVAVHSGLAYGIDITAHKAALEFGLPTYGTLAHGLDRIYPAAHKSIANQMLQEGGWISEFLSGTNPDRENFPKRNRIVAGISDATIVVESAKKGGSIITANLANSYNKDVFALPGRKNDLRSEGCNYLIKSHKAHLIESAQDLIDIMGWKDEKKAAQTVQTQLFSSLNEDESSIIRMLQERPYSIDEISSSTKIPMADLSTKLLMMEFDGLVKPLPGKIYELA